MFTSAFGPNYKTLADEWRTASSESIEDFIRQGIESVAVLLWGKYYLFAYHIFRNSIKHVDLLGAWKYNTPLYPLQELALQRRHQEFDTEEPR